MTRDSVSVRPNAFRCPVVATVIDSFFSDVPKTSLGQRTCHSQHTNAPLRAGRPLVSGCGGEAATRAAPHTSSSIGSSRGPRGGVKPRSRKSSTRSPASPTRSLRRNMRVFQAKMLGEHVPRAVDLLTDIVLAPRFDAEELERVRMVIFEEKSDR